MCPGKGLKQMVAVCPVCDRSLKVGIREWHRKCDACTYEGSTLRPHILDQAKGGDLDEELRQEGLAGLRQANFRRLSERLRTLVKRDEGSRPKLLDVGCAHGWFLVETSDYFDPIGIEPEPEVAEATRSRGGVVRTGFFPDVLDGDERFDVISFNDVLEHIPDINGALAACASHLNVDGVLMVNAPSRRGMLYNIAKVLARFGQDGTFGRLWQKGFPSPHVHYLDAQVMTALAQRHGFTLVDHIPLASVVVKGLYARIRFSRQVSVPKAMALTVAMTVLCPLLRVLPPDIETWFFRPAESTTPRQRMVL